MFDKRRFLDLIRYFIVFEDDGDGQPIKKMAGYHQFHAVNTAIEQTVRAAMEKGNVIEDDAGITKRVNRAMQNPVTAALASSGTRRVRQKPDDGILRGTHGTSCTPPCKTPPSWSSPTATT